MKLRRPNLQFGNPSDDGEEIMTENDSKNPEAKQWELSTSRHDFPDEKTNLRRLRRAMRAAGEAISENQWLLPVAGSVIGVLLAILLGRAGSDPDPSTWSITVNAMRNAVLSALSILFAGLSIVLALASGTIQNVVGRFSLRLLRIYLRNPWDKAVIAVFAMAATFILVEWYLLSATPPDSLAPMGGVLTGLLLLFLSGATIIWYISALSSWVRVDRTVQRVANLTLHAARSVERQHRQDSPAVESSFKRPAEAITMLAPRSGYLTEVDREGLYDLAQRYDVELVIDCSTGQSIVKGEPIGWIASVEGASGELPSADILAEMIDITGSRQLDRAVGYGILVLVDIAIMALSPGVNDPNTAVQVIEEMTFLFPQLALVRSGPLVRSDEEGRQRVAVKAFTFGDYVEMATAQIVLHSGGDPAVIMALERFARILQGLDLTEGDQQAVETFAARVLGITRTMSDPEGQTI